jgi:hypothetical protein
MMIGLEHFTTIMALPPSFCSILFKYFDVDHGGSIDIHEFCKGLGVVKFLSDPATRIDTAFKIFDTNNDQTVDFDEFVYMIKVLKDYGVKCLLQNASTEINRYFAEKKFAKGTNFAQFQWIKKNKKLGKDIICGVTVDRIVQCLDENYGNMTHCKTLQDKLSEAIVNVKNIYGDPVKICENIFHDLQLKTTDKLSQSMFQKWAKKNDTFNVLGFLDEVKARFDTIVAKPADSSSSSTVVQSRHSMNTAVVSQSLHHGHGHGHDDDGDDDSYSGLCGWVYWIKDSVCGPCCGKKEKVKVKLDTATPPSVTVPVSPTAHRVTKPVHAQSTQAVHHTVDVGNNNADIRNRSKSLGVPA